jgi:hypothetical protein
MAGVSITVENPAKTSVATIEDPGESLDLSAKHFQIIDKLVNGMEIFLV